MEKVSCSQRIDAALHARGMKQVDLCRATNIPKSAMSQYISGAFEPKQDRVWAIAQALNVSEAWLMGFDVPMEKVKPSTDSGKGLDSEVDELLRSLSADDLSIVLAVARQMRQKEIERGK